MTLSCKTSLCLRSRTFTHERIIMTRRDVSRSPIRRKVSPIVRQSSDSDSSGHKDSSAQGSEAAQRKPLRHLLLLGLALLFGALLGAVSTSTPSTAIVNAPPHSRLRFVEPKTTEEQPARPAARRPSHRRRRRPPRWPHSCPTCRPGPRARTRRHRSRSKPLRRASRSPARRRRPCLLRGIERSQLYLS